MATWLPDAQRQTWNTNGGTFTGGPPKGVLHTTEGMSWPGYDGGTTAPHLTARANFTQKWLEIRQHIPLDVAARALVNRDGGVQTNRDHAIQVELVGTCDPTHRGDPGWLYWPDAPAWAMDALATLLRRLEAFCGIAHLAVDDWVPYPTSYGRQATQRMSLSQWDAFSGWCGHQHVPENEHGDPGDLKVPLLMNTLPVANLPTVVPIHTRERQPIAAAPAFPLPSGNYFGPRNGPAQSHSGYYSATDRNHLRVWQAQMRTRGQTIAVDGLYGPGTNAVARALQTQRRLPADGLIGPRTWAAAWATR